jgi:hypothetical protein
MEKVTMTIDELNTAISFAVNAAIDARELKDVASGKKTYLSRIATAKRLDRNVSTLWRWARKGHLTPVHVGGRVMYAEDDIIRIENGEILA